MFLQTDDKLWHELEAIAREEGVHVYDVEHGSGFGIRVFVDKSRVGGSPEPQSDSGSTAQGGVTSDECTRLCRRLRVFFTAEAPSYGFSGDMAIEVSSPGINRHLRLHRHYANAVGQRIKVTIKPQQNGVERRNKETVTGNLKEVSQEGMVIDVEGAAENMRVSFAEVERARVDFAF